MRFKVERKALRIALRKISFFLTNSSSEWSNSVSLIVKSKDGISALDLFLQTPMESFQTLVPAAGVEDHADEEVVIDGALLVEIVKKSTEDDLQFHVDFDAGLIKISSGSTEWDVPFLLKTLSRVKLEAEPEIWSSEELSTALGKVKSSLGLDIGRPYLMMAKVSEGRLQACDGFKLQETRITNKNINMEIPSRSVFGLSKLLEEDGWKDSNFSIYAGDKATCLRNNFDKFCFHNPKSPFPDLTEMVVNPLKSKIPSLITVDRKELISKIEQVNVMSGKESQIGFELDGTTLKVICEGKSRLRSEAELRVNWTGAKRSLCFETKSLLSVLNSLSEEKTEIRISDKGGPIVVEEENLWSMLNQAKAIR